MERLHEASGRGRGRAQAWSPRPQQPARELKVFVYELPFAMSQLLVSLQQSSVHVWSGLPRLQFRAPAPGRMCTCIFLGWLGAAFPNPGTQPHVHLRFPACPTQ